MGIKPKFVVFRKISTIKAEKSAAKFHYIKTVTGKVVAQSIAFRVVSIYWQGIAPFPWYLNAKGPTPIGSTCVAHTSSHSAAAVRDIEKSLITANMQSKTGFPVITGRTAWNWRHSVLSADAGLLVRLYLVLFMVALWNRADHYIFILWFLSSSIFFLLLA